MLMPSIFGENLLDDFFDLPSFQRSEKTAGHNMMTTDVKEKEDSYEISMNLPGFKKEDVKGEIKDGYLTIKATVNKSNDVKDKAKDGKERYIRRERYCGSCQRSFYVGDDITESDINAKFEDGVLIIDIPKKEPVKNTDEKHYISIS